MAIVITQPVAVFNATTNLTAYTTASFTPAANSLLVALVFCSGNGSPGTFDAGGLTWTRLTGQLYNTADYGLLFYAQVGPSPAAMSGVYTVGNATAATGCIIQMLQVVGHDQTSPIVQYIAAGGVGANPKVTFAAATNASSGVILGVGIPRLSPTATGPTGFTEQFDGGYNTPAAGAAVYHSTNKTLALYTITTASSNYGMFGVEVRAATLSGTLDKTLANVTLSGAGLSDQPSPAGTSKVRYVKVTSQSSNNHIVEIKALDNNSINQALNKSVLLGNPIGGDSSRLTNGDLSRDTWTDLGGAGSNVTVDLNGLFDIASVNVLYYYGGGWNYYTKIEVSPDGKAWYVAEDGTHVFTPVNADTTGRTVAVPTYSYSRVGPTDDLMKARYIRETFYSGGGYAVDLQVLDYQGNNLALGKPVTLSAVGGTVYPTITDGITGTAGFQGFGNSALYLDLGSVQAFDSVRLHNYNDSTGYRYNVIVDVSVDNVTWTNLWDWNYDGSTAYQSGDVIPGKRSGQNFGRAKATLAGVTTASSGTVTGPYVSPPTSKVRFIRDTLASGSNEIAWQEIQALDKFGVNKALGCSVTQVFDASGRLQQGSPLSVVTDGGLGSYCWYYGPAALMVDLGSTLDIASIKRWHGTGSGVRNVNLLEVSPNGIDWYTVFDSNVSGTYPEYVSGREDPVPAFVWNTLGGADVTLLGVTPWNEGTNANTTYLPTAAGTYSIERQYGPYTKPAFGVIDRGNPDATPITGYWTFEGHLYSLASKRGDAGGSRADGFKFGSSDVGRYIQHGGSGLSSIITGLTASKLGIDGNKAKVIIAEFDLDTNMTGGDRCVFSIGLNNGQQDFSCVPNGGTNIKFNFWGNDLNFGIPNSGAAGLYRVFAAFGHNGTNAYVHIWTRHAATGATQSATVTGVFAPTNTADTYPLTFLQGGTNNGAWGQYPYPLYRVIVFAGIDMSRAQFERIRANPNKLIRAPYTVVSAGDGSIALPPRKGAVSKWLAGVTVDAAALITQPDNPPRLGALNVQLASVTVNATGTAPTDASLPHKLWRFNITALNGGNQQGMSEIEMRATANGTDMCVGGIAAASAIYDGSFAASMAFDNNFNTRWSTNGIPVAWISYEFASPTPIAEYTVAPVDASRGWKNFTLEFSDDNGATWTIADTRTNVTSWVAQTPMVFTVPGSTPAAPTINGALVQTLQNVAVSASGTITNGPQTYPVRYIRDWLYGSTSNGGNHFAEVQAYNGSGTNVALGKTATPSATPTGGTVGMVTDGNTDVSGFVFLELPGNTLVNVTVDLGSVMQIASVAVWHYYADSRSYYGTKTEVSVDGVTWYAVYDSMVSGIYPESSSGATYSAAYAVGRVGTAAATLQGVTRSAAGTVATTGALARTLAGVSVSASGLSPKTITSITDTFDSGVIDGSIWYYSGDPGTSQMISGGKLSITTVAGGTGYSGIYSQQHLPFAGSSAFVRITASATNVETASGALRIVHWDAGFTAQLGYSVVQISGQYLQAGYSTGGPFIYLNGIAYDPAAHAWLRLRESAGMTYWDVAPATASNPPASNQWTNLWAYQNAVADTSHTGIELSAGNYLTETSAVTYTFDGLNAAANMGILRRALVWLGDRISQITDALKGTGKKPLVLVGGVKQERVASEGQPLVLINGQVQTLPSGDTLDI